MKIAVCLKQVPATDSKIKPAADGVSADLSSAEWVINPYDEFALEEALQIKEKHDGEVVVLSVGGEKIEEAVRSALALGADKAVVLKDAEYSVADPLAVSAALAAMVKSQEPDLVFCGKQAVDTDQMAVPAMLAERLDWPQATVVVKLELADDLKSAKAEREVEGGHEEVEFSLPAVVAAQKGLNEPRYASLKGIMAAKKKPIETVSAADLGLPAVSPRMDVVEVTLPAQERKGRMIEGDPGEQAAELARALHDEEKLI